MTKNRSSSKAQPPAGRRRRKDDWLIIWINKDLVWTHELEMFRAVGRQDLACGVP